MKVLNLFTRLVGNMETTDSQSGYRAYSRRAIENLANMIKQNIDPVVYPSIRVEEVDDKQVVLTEVEESKQKPVLAFGRAYKRVGKANQKESTKICSSIATENCKVCW